MTDNCSTYSICEPEVPWTEDEDASLKRLFKAGIQEREIATELHRTIASVRIRCRRLHLPRFYGDTGRRRYTKNNTFFTVPNPINSYYAGLLAADGSVNWDEHCVRWSLAEQDVCLLRNFKQATQYTGRIGFKLNLSSLGKEPSRQNFLDVYSARQWCIDLHENFGIVPQKSHRVEPPRTASDLLCACFIRGYIDGDGSMCFTDNGSWAVSITSCSPRLLEFVKSFVDRHFFSAFTAKRGTVRHYDNYYVYTIHGYRAIQLFDFLRALPVPSLARKWDNPDILKVMNVRKAKHPELFKVENVLSFNPAGAIVRHANVESPELQEAA